MTELITRAHAFAEAAHGAIGQVRKYTGEPYIVHPQAVALLVQGVTSDEEVIAAAWLHDVVEDTRVDIATINRHFGYRVARFVSELTDTPIGRNRAQRKAADRERLRTASSAAQTIKVADLIDNAHSITDQDPEFAKVYMREKRSMLDVLTNAKTSLRMRAEEILREYEERQLDLALARGAR